MSNNKIIWVMNQLCIHFTQPTFTSSGSAMETPEQYVKIAQS